MIDNMKELCFIALMGLVVISLLWVSITFLKEHCLTKISDICGYWITQNDDMFQIYETDDGCYIHFTEAARSKKSGSYLIHYKNGNKFFFIRDNVRYELVYCKKRKNMSIKQVSNCMKMATDTYNPAQRIL